MSRRTPNPAAERAAQNAQTIKSLLRLEGNKTCADCKKNKHPRWASWNLGVFICIRCSGIHRGMGTHISRVKSVDLDAWTDEQLQSILKWGNLRANKYWESKLSTGHIPSESKIENFIRTKYESKRWVMEGPMPDPSTLEVEGDDDVPLSLVKEKQNIERSTSRKINSTQPGGLSQSKRTQQSDVLESNISVPYRESSVNSSSNKASARSDSAPPKQVKPMDSLLGLDFFGTGTAPPSRSSNPSPIPGVQSRPDLKQSILSLYATVPRPQQQSSQSQNIFGAMQSPVKSPAKPSDRNTSLGSISDAFSSLNVSNQKSSITTATTQIQSGSPAFSELGNLTSPKISLSNGPSDSTVQPSRGFSMSNGFGAFSSAPGPSPTKASNVSSGIGDMFDFSTPIATYQATTSVPKPSVASPVMQQTSVYNLSQVNPPQAKPSLPPVSTNLYSNNDAWGSNNAWANASDPSPQNKVMVPQTSFEEPGWGTSSGSMTGKSGMISHVGNGISGGISGNVNSFPVVSADEDFGGWGSATTASVAPSSTTTVTTNTVSQKPAAGFAGNDDLFSNVWG